MPEHSPRTMRIAEVIAFAIVWGLILVSLGLLVLMLATW